MPSVTNAYVKQQIRERNRLSQAKRRHPMNAADIAALRAQSATCCPICVQEFTRLDNSERVCAIHLNWFVTTCCVCGAVSFSDCRGYCMKHGQDNGSSRTLGYNKDHRYMLRVYGYEGFER